MSFESVTIGPCTLYLGDCLEVLPTLAPGGVDAVVTDPPYGIGFKYESYDDSESAYAELMKAVIRSVGDLSPKTCWYWQAMLHADKWHEWFPSPFRIFAACKGFVQFMPTPVQFSWDPVIWWGTPSGESSVYRKDYHEQRLAPFGFGRERIDHPCPRPVEQVEYITDLASVIGETILDPFMGSGTTGVACIRTERRFIGIEKEPKYFDIACKRIEREWQLKRSELPFEKPAKETQRELIPA